MQKRYWIPSVVILTLTAVGIYGASLPPSAAEKKASAAAKSKKKAEEKPVFAVADKYDRTSAWYADAESAEGDHEALTKVSFSNYSCRWDSGRVRVTMTVRNPMGAHITVHLQPSYHLLNAGLHGDGFNSQQDIGVDAGATRDWTTRLDTAEGVKGTPKITACVPEINGIDLG